MEVWNYKVSYIEHHGIKGQKWGVRRYQKPDGRLTLLGRAHYRSAFMRAYSEQHNESKKTMKAAHKAVKAGRLSYGKYINAIEQYNEAANRWNSLYWHTNKIKTIEDLKNNTLVLGNIQTNNQLIRRALNTEFGKQILPEKRIKLVKTPTELKFNNGTPITENTFELDTMKRHSLK